MAIELQTRDRPDFSPVIADVMPDRAGLEVVVQSGCYFPQKEIPKRGAWIKVLRGRDGKVLRTLSIPTCSSSQVAVADLDGDGELEIVATVSGSAAYGGDGFGSSSEAVHRSKWRFARCHHPRTQAGRLDAEPAVFHPIR